MPESTAPSTTLQDAPHTARQAWMALLARAPLALLEEALAAQALLPCTWLRKPETGLVMVRGRAGGTAEKFNLGEATVTRCTLRLEDGNTGVAYILGRSQRHAHLAALADALLQDSDQHAHWNAHLLAPIAQALDEKRAEQQRQAQATKVEFFTVAREAKAQAEATA